MAEEPNVAWSRFGCRWLPLILVMAVSLAGCRTPRAPEPTPVPAANVSPLPPATRTATSGAQNVIAEASASTRLFLLTWYADRFASLPSCAASVHLARKGADQAERELQGEVREQWQDTSGGLIAPVARGRIGVPPQAVAEQHTRADFAVQLKTLLELTGKPIEIKAELEDCLPDDLWPESVRAYRPEFVAWYQKHQGTLTLKPPLGTEVVRRDLRQLQTATAIRETVLERLLAVEELERRRKFVSALADVEKLADDKEAENALRTLHDTETVQRIVDKRTFLPQNAVSEECEYLGIYYRRPLDRLMPTLADEWTAKDRDEAERLVHVLEARLSQRLTKWQADTRFAGALRRYATDIRELVQTALDGRVGLWEMALRGEEGPLRAWRQYELLKPWLASLRDYSGAGGVAFRYVDEGMEQATPLSRTALQVAQERLLPVYAAALPETFAAWQRFSEQQVNLYLRHGIDLAVADRILEMASVFPADAVPAAVADAVRWAKDRSVASLDRFVAKDAGCSIRIEPMSSAISGLGLTWARDLESSLREMLVRSGYQTFVRVTPVGGEGEKLPRTLVIDRGRIADFSADDTTEKTTMREVTEYGEPKAVDAGHLRGEYAQDVMRRAIHSLIIERVAHVRVQFQLHCGDTTQDVEVNRFFRKQFVQETSHPFLDMAVVETRQAERRSELQPASQPLQLRSDRVWTASEMLDWARRAALAEMAMQVEVFLGNYPLSLVQQAETATKGEDWLAATDAWGYATACLSRLREPGENEVPLEEPPKAVVARRAEIAKWRAESRRQLARALLRALEEWSQTKEQP
jgi:hypothetical protein